MEITAALLLVNGFLIAIFHGVPSGLEPKVWTFPPKFKRADFTLCSFKILINVLLVYPLAVLPKSIAILLFNFIVLLFFERVIFL